MFGMDDTEDGQVVNSQSIPSDPEKEVPKNWKHSAGCIEEYM